VNRNQEDPLQLVRFSALLGFALTDNGNFAEAERVVARAMAVGAVITDSYARARLYWSDFKLRGEQGQSALAEESARKALEILRVTEDDHALALLHQALAHINLDLDRVDEASDYLDRGRLLMERSGTPLELAQYHIEEARVYSRRGDLERALGLANAASTTLGDAHGTDVGRAYVLLGEIWETAGEATRAREVYELAVELLEQRGPTRYLVRAYRQLAGVLKALGQRDEALELLERAVGVQDRVGRRLV
jgi:tetratricopeptide (TPR) repeat protein